MEHPNRNLEGHGFDSSDFFCAPRLFNVIFVNCMVFVFIFSFTLAKPSQFERPVCRRIWIADYFKFRIFCLHKGDIDDVTSLFPFQWNLICDRAHVGANVQAAYAAGMLVGSFIFGAISDIFGRRFCMLLCSALAVSLSLI